MRNEIPKEILCEMEPLGGLNGIVKRLPNKKSIIKLASSHEALSEPVRLQILLILRQGKLCVCVIKALTSCPDTRLSYHLSKLKRMNLIKSQRQKSFLKYYLTGKGKKTADELMAAIANMNKY